jgi:L-asparagine oxygenase
MVSFSQVSSDLRNNGFWRGHVGSAADALHMAAQMGGVTRDPRHPNDLRRISPQPLEAANPNTLSSRYGLGAFPYHTEVAHWRTPASLVFLFCEQPGRGSRRTLLIDSQAWTFSEREYHVLTQGVWKVAFLNPFLATVADSKGNGIQLRFDLGCMRPYGRRALAAQEVIMSRLESSQDIEVEWHAGELLVLDNFRMLHARGPAKADDTDRVLCRILVGGGA